MNANRIAGFGFGVELTASFLGLLSECSANAKDWGSSLALPTAYAGLMSLCRFRLQVKHMSILQSQGKIPHEDLDDIDAGDLKNEGNNERLRLQSWTVEIPSPIPGWGSRPWRML
jgi:hypothetical protein